MYGGIRSRRGGAKRGKSNRQPGFPTAGPRPHARAAARGVEAVAVQRESGAASPSGPGPSDYLRRKHPGPMVSMNSGGPSMLPPALVPPAPSAASLASRSASPFMLNTASALCGAGVPPGELFRIPGEDDAESVGGMEDERRGKEHSGVPRGEMIAREKQGCQDEIRTQALACPRRDRYDSTPTITEECRAITIHMYREHGLGHVRELLNGHSALVLCIAGLTAALGVELNAVVSSKST